MSLVDTIARFATGTYVVTRTTAGTSSQGRVSIGSVSTFNILASIRPVAGAELEVLDVAEHMSEVRSIYTTTELKTRSPGFAPDQITIAGEIWEVFRVLRYEISGFFKVYAARQTLP